MATEYLTVQELSQRIKYSEQSIYNLIHNRTFIEGIQYFKPTPKKILFKWQAIISWIECKNDNTIESEKQSVELSKKSPSLYLENKTQPIKNRINI